MLGLTSALATVLIALAAPASAQVGAFDWAPAGSQDGSASVVGDTLHIVGPDHGTCSGETTWLETVAPIDGVVSATVLFVNHDPSCSLDAPVWVVNDEVFQAPAEIQICWLSGTYAISFEVQAGDRFGFGVWSSDCWLGAGVADVVDFVFASTTSGWRHLGHALDPRLGATFAGLESDARFGRSVAGLDDLDGDGVPELIVGAPFEGDSGAVHVLSGADGSELYAIELGSPGARFGFSVADAGDLDGDGTGDFVVGAPRHKTAGVPGSATPGLVAAWSGATGAELFTIEGSVFAGRLGWAVAGAGDVDADGFDDVVAGQPGNSSTVLVLSGADGSLLHSTAFPGGTRAGTSLASMDDVTGDGVPDLVTGAPHGTSPLAAPATQGAVHIMSGTDGSVVLTLTGAGAFGWSLAVVPDADGDGLQDIAVGAPSELDPSTDERVGGAHLFSSATGVELAAVSGTQVDGLFGQSLAGGADFDGDGHGDLAVGASQTGADDLLGSVSVLRLPDLEPTALLTTGAHALGTSLARLADSDGDGLDELLVGGPQGSTLTGPAATGVVHVFDALELIAPPRLTGTGTLQPGTEVTLALAGAPSAATAWLVIGSQPSTAPFAGGVLVPHPDLVQPFATSPAGALSIRARWPVTLPDFHTFWLQAWLPHTDGPSGWIASGGLRAGAYL